MQWISGTCHMNYLTKLHKHNLTPKFHRESMWHAIWPYFSFSSLILLKHGACLLSQIWGNAVTCVYQLHIFQVVLLTVCLLTANCGTTSLFWKVCVSQIEWKQAWQSGEHSEAHIQQHVRLHEHMRLWKESGLAQPWRSNPVLGARDGDWLLDCWTMGADANTAAAKEFTVSRTQNISKSNGLLFAWCCFISCRLLLIVLVFVAPFVKLKDRGLVSDDFETWSM